jgi:protein TonB
MPDTPFPAPRRRRPIAVWIAASAAVHALAFGGLPGSPAREAERPRVSVLDVVLLEVGTPVPAAPRPPVARPQPQPRPAPRLLSPLAAAPAAPAPVAPAPVAPAPPVAERAAPAPAAPAAAPSDHRNAAAAEPAAAAAPAPLTPPLFNAAYLRNPPPRYPLAARRNGEQGTVTLKVLVTRDGAAASVALEKSSGSLQLDAAALEAVRHWRFVPARQGAQPVEAWVLVPIVFRLEDA